MIAAAFRESGIVVRENFGTIESFEKTPTGVRMIFAKDGVRDSAEAALAVVAVGWAANTTGLNLGAAGVELIIGVSCGSTLTCGPPRRIFSPLEI